MKNIIFEVIKSIIISNDYALTFDQQVISSMIESINLYGMSIQKFRRILRMLMAQFFFENDLFFIHDGGVELMSRRGFEESKTNML